MTDYLDFRSKVVSSLPSLEISVNPRRGGFASRKERLTFLPPPTLAPSVLSEQTALPSHLENLVFAGDFIIEPHRVRNCSFAGAAGCLRLVRCTARRLSNLGGAGYRPSGFLPIGLRPERRF